MVVAGAQYLLPEGVEQASIAAALAAHLDVEEDGERSADRTFYDTFDGRLHSEGLVAVYDDGRLAVLDAAAYGERASTASETAPERILAAELPAGALRDLLAPLIEMRALTPIARVRSRLGELRVLNASARRSSGSPSRSRRWSAPGARATRCVRACTCARCGATTRRSPGCATRSRPTSASRRRACRCTTTRSRPPGGRRAGRRRS